MLLEIIGACDYGTLILRAKVRLCLCIPDGPFEVSLQAFSFVGIQACAFFWPPPARNALRRLAIVVISFFKVMVSLLSR